MKQRKLPVLQKLGKVYCLLEKGSFFGKKRSKTKLKTGI
jgi:hypothetical protein